MTREEIIRRLVALHRELLQEVARHDLHNERGGPRQEWIDEVSSIIGALMADQDSE